jgi:hypothetical protein
MICGNTLYSDRKVPVSIFVPHRGSSVNISFKGYFDEATTNESFGISNLRVLTASCSSSTCSLAATEFTAATFSVTSGWTNSNSVDVSGNVKTCSSTSFFGGHGLTIDKTYTGLSTH